MVCERLTLTRRFSDENCLSVRIESGPPRATGHLLVFEHGNVRHAVVRVVALVISDNDPSGRKVESRRERRRRDDYLDKVGAEPRLDEFPVVDEKAGVVKCRSVAHAVGELLCNPGLPVDFRSKLLGVEIAL